MVEWLERRDCDRHGLGSKPTRAILLCPSERYFTAPSPAWWSWQAVAKFQSSSSFGRASTPTRHKQDWGREFIILLLHQAAVQPGSNASSNVINKFQSYFY